MNSTWEHVWESIEFDHSSNLVEDKSLWKGQLKIEGDRQKMDKLIHKCLNEQVTVLALDGKGSSTVPTISADDIRAIAEKCPNMEELVFYNVDQSGWPSLRDPWLSMRILHINRARRDCFDNVALHESVPNLEQIAFSGHQRDDPIILPDMNGCEKLEKVDLLYGRFRMPGIIPFPPGLLELYGAVSLLGLNSHETAGGILLEILKHCPTCGLG